MRHWLFRCSAYPACDFAVLACSAPAFLAARGGAGPPPERARRVRFLRAVAVLVAVLLRGGRRARQRRALAGAMRRAAVLLRGARAVAAIRARLSRILPAAVAAARPQHHVSMLDLMPAPGLIFNEWDKHGTCSGLGARAYFETIRKARAAVKIPDEFLQLADAEDGRAGRGRGRLHQGQSGPEQRRRSR